MTNAQLEGAARATVRYLHTSPYKIRQVLELVRGLPVEDAQRILQLCEKDAADDVRKLLTSAMSNAEHNSSLEPDELFVARAWADEGPTRKWGQPRARGRYFRIRKRTSHVTIVLERFDVEELEERRRREEATGRGAATAQRRRAERVRRSRQARDTDAADETEEDASAAEPEVTEASAASDAVTEDQIEAELDAEDAVEAEVEEAIAADEDAGDDSAATEGERSVESTQASGDDSAATEGERSVESTQTSEEEDK
jgi:large subunit ribosomal protein L22